MTIIVSQRGLSDRLASIVDGGHTETSARQQKASDLRDCGRHAALHRYRPGCYSGEVILVRPTGRDMAPLRVGSQREGLTEASRLAVQRVAGDHYSMVTGVGAADCARVIRAALNGTGE